MRAFVLVAAAAALTACHSRCLAPATQPEYRVVDATEAPPESLPVTVLDSRATTEAERDELPYGHVTVLDAGGYRIRVYFTVPSDDLLPAVKRDDALTFVRSRREEGDREIELRAADGTLVWAIGEDPPSDVKVTEGDELCAWHWECGTQVRHEVEAAVGGPAVAMQPGDTAALKGSGFTAHFHLFDWMDDESSECGEEKAGHGFAYRRDP